MMRKTWELMTSIKRCVEEVTGLVNLSFVGLRALMYQISNNRPLFGSHGEIKDALAPNQFNRSF